MRSHDSSGQRNIYFGIFLVKISNYIFSWVVRVNVTRSNHNQYHRYKCPQIPTFEISHSILIKRKEMKKERKNKQTKKSYCIRHFFSIETITTVTAIPHIIKSWSNKTAYMIHTFHLKYLNIVMSILQRSIQMHIHKIYSIKL